MLTRKVLISAISYIVISVVGFLGTIYFARTLGAAALGIFALGMSVIKWLQLADLGVTKSAIKRISEGTEAEEFLTAAALIQVTIGILTTSLVWVFNDSINTYIGGDYTLLVGVIFLLNYSAYGVILQTIKGSQQAHVADGLDAIERLLRVLLQVGFVIVGFEVFGMFLGVVGSLVVVTLLGVGYLLLESYARFAVPSKRHFMSLFDYAKYSMLASVKGQAYSWADITILGFFVTQSVIGVYQVSWTLAMFFGIFSRALRNNLFPEISNISTQDDDKRLQNLFSESLIYAGIIPIPGIVGAAVLGDPILGIYGQEFRAGSGILVLLTLVSILRSFEDQVLTFLDGMDLPVVTFRINAVFVVTNIILNIILVWKLGAVGAAIGTVIAVAVSLGLGWRSITSVINANLPFKELGKQVFAALMMGAIVLSIRQMVNVQPVRFLLPVVFGGAAVYFGILLIISQTIRSKVLALLPVSI